jgi:hypothetical protein
MSTSTINDQYGREIIVQTGVVSQTAEGAVTEDVYSLEGVDVWLPAGTPQHIALQTIEAMAPDWWTPPAPEQPIEEEQVMAPDWWTAPPIEEEQV